MMGAHHAIQNEFIPCVQLGSLDLTRVAIDQSVTAAYFYAEQTISTPTALPVWGATISTHLSLRAYALVVGRLRDYGKFRSR